MVGPSACRAARATALRTWAEASGISTTRAVEHPPADPHRGHPSRRHLDPGPQGRQRAHQPGHGAGHQRGVADEGGGEGPRRQGPGQEPQGRRRVARIDRPRRGRPGAHSRGLHPGLGHLHAQGPQGPDGGGDVGSGRQVGHPAGPGGHPGQHQGPVGERLVPGHGRGGAERPRRQGEPPHRLIMPCRGSGLPPPSTGARCRGAGWGRAPGRWRCEPGPAPGGPTAASRRRTSRLRPSPMTTSTSASLPCCPTQAGLPGRGPGPSSSSTPPVRARSALRPGAPVDPGQVGLGHLVAGVGDVGRQVAVVGEEDQAFAVGVQPPHRVYPSVLGHQARPRWAGPAGRRRCSPRPAVCRAGSRPARGGWAAAPRRPRPGRRPGPPSGPGGPGCPSTVTRPARTISSAARREARPEWAISRWSRSMAPPVGRAPRGAPPPPPGARDRPEEAVRRGNAVPASPRTGRWWRTGLPPPGRRPGPPRRPARAAPACGGRGRSRRPGSRTPEPARPGWR